MLDTRGYDKELPNVIEKLEDGSALRNALLTVLSETDEEKAQVYYDRIAEHATVNNGNLENLDPHYLLDGHACKDGVCSF